MDNSTYSFNYTKKVFDKLKTKLDMASILSNKPFIEKLLSQRNLLGQSSGVFLFRLINSLLSLVLSVIIARCLGVKEYGIYAYILTIINLLLIPAYFGLPELITKNIASYSAESRWGLFKGILIKSIRTLAASSFLIILLSLLVGFSLKREFNEYIAIFWIALILIPFESINKIRFSILRGLHKVIIGQLPDILFQPVFLILIVCSMYYFATEGRLSSTDIVLARVASVFAALIMGLYFLAKHIPKEAKQSPPEYDANAWNKSALAFMIIQGINQLFGQTDILMLGLLGDAESVGLYKVASSAALLIGFALLSINSVLGPIISKLAAKKSWAELQTVITYSSRLIFTVTLPASLVLIFYGRQFLGMIYGEDFTSGSSALAILAFGQLINAALGSVGLILNMTGNEKASLTGQAISLFLNFLLNLILIPKWGINGAAIATCISLIFWNVLLAWLVYARLNIHTTALGKNIGFLIMARKQT